MNSIEVAQELLTYEIKPSYPRVQIYKYLEDNRNHPTAHDIYSDLVNEIPTLSKTTVYNTLDRFLEVGLVLALNLDENEKRYDIVTDDHSHFRCEVCDQIYDIPYDDIDLLPKGYEGFQIKEKHIFLKGICKKCTK